jgi:hypothetical protein
VPEAHIDVDYTVDDLSTPFFRVQERRTEEETERRKGRKGKKR